MARRGRSGWTQAFGRAAEAFAARHLESHGCRILAERYRCRRGEIDLIVRDGDVVAFVEVKARRRSDFGDPVHAVNGRKQRRIIATARDYLRQDSAPAGACRFDVVSVRVRDGRAHATWLRDAFRP
jgi:putative endonuclease